MFRNRRTVHSAVVPLLDAGLDRLFDRDALVRLAAHTDVVRVGAAATLAVEGTTAHQFTAIIDGEATVHRAGLAPTTCGPGSWFGLSELVSGRYYDATVVTTAPSSLVVVVFGPPLHNALAARGRRAVDTAAPSFTVGFAGGCCAG